MNHEATEKSKKQPISNRQYVLLWLKIYFVGAVVLFIIWQLFPIYLWGFNYLKWQNSEVEDYKLYLFRAELLRDADYIEPFTFEIYDEEGVFRGTYPAYVFKEEYDSVSILFSVAWDKIWNPFARCLVTYDEQYGFPDLISCGQWQQIQSFDFEPISNNK